MVLWSLGSNKNLWYVRCILDSRVLSITFLCAFFRPLCSVSKHLPLLEHKDSQIFYFLSHQLLAQQLSLLQQSNNTGSTQVVLTGAHGRMERE